MNEQSNVSLSALPLKAYDFFSIVFPGVSVLLSAYFFEDLYRESQSSVATILPNSCLPVHWLVVELWQNSSNLSTQAAIAAISMCVIYLAGHLVSSISNFFLDRIFVYKCYGYPYEHLLLENYKNKTFVDYFSRRFYRGSIFWLHAAIFFFALYNIYRTYSIFFVIAFSCSCFFLVALAIHLVVQPFCKKHHKMEIPCNIFIKLYAGFYEILMNPIQHINQTALPAQKQLAEKYRTFFKNDFGIDPRNAESENYWFSVFYVRQKSPPMSELVHRWHQTAVFARNMAAAFYMTFCYSTLILWYETAWKKHVIQVPDNFRITIALTGMFAVAIFLVLRFYYFYVCYYSKCLFRAFVFLHLNKDINHLL
jgi:hypothetical protein